MKSSFIRHFCVNNNPQWLQVPKRFWFSSDFQWVQIPRKSKVSCRSPKVFGSLQIFNEYRFPVNPKWRSCHHHSVWGIRRNQSLRLEKIRNKFSETAHSMSRIITTIMIKFSEISRFTPLKWYKIHWTRLKEMLRFAVLEWLKIQLKRSTINFHSEKPSST